MPNRHLGLSTTQTIDHFERIETEKPVDLIIEQVRNLINSGRLKPGDRLPSESTLQQKMGVKRTDIREAFRRLEFFGIVRTKPQSGTYVENIGIKALEGLIANVLRMERGEFISLIDTRATLECRVVELVCQNASDEDLHAIEESHLAFSEQVAKGGRGLEEDVLFHLKLAECCKNSILRMLVTLLAPDVLRFSADIRKIQRNRVLQSVKEHAEILRSIKGRNPLKARKAMERHMRGTLIMAREASAETT